MLPTKVRTIIIHLQLDQVILFCLQHTLLIIIAFFSDRLFENFENIDVNSVDLTELKTQIYATFVFIGNFRNLPANLFKHLNSCHKGDYANVSVSATHNILLVVNCFYFISFLIETCKFNRTS